MGDSVFWFWFLRPIAEMLSGIALVSSVMVIGFVWVVAQEWLIRRKSKKESKDGS